MAIEQTVLAAALALLGGMLPLILWKRGRWLHVLAAAALLFPVMEDVVAFIDLAPLIGEYTVLRPYSPEQLAELPWRIARDNLTVPLIGLAIVAVLGGWHIAREHLAPFLRSWRPWGQELFLGWGIVPIIVAAETLAILALEGPASFLRTGDESALFSNATWIHVVALSMVPALVEETYYRGLLQGLFAWAVPGQRAVWWAIGLQGLLFAIAHAGFTTLSHLLGPLIFGLGMGYLRATVGLGACMVGHFSVNLLFFSLDPGAGSLPLIMAAMGLAVLGLYVLALERETLIERVRRGPQLRPTR